MVVKSNVKTKWANEENQVFLNKNDPTASTIFVKYYKLIEEAMLGKLLDILYKVLEIVFKGGNRDYIVINKQGWVSWSSKKRGHHFVFTKSLLKEARKFLLQNCFFSMGIKK